MTEEINILNCPKCGQKWKTLTAFTNVAHCKNGHHWKMREQSENDKRMIINIKKVNQEISKTLFH